MDGAPARSRAACNVLSRMPFSGIEVGSSRRLGDPVVTGPRWWPPLGALLFLLAVLLASGGPTGRSSEAAPATLQPQATVQRGAGPSGQSPTLLGDINNDGIVDIRDYGIWRQNFGQTNCGNPADLDGNCLVDIRASGIWPKNSGQPAPPVPPTPAAPPPPPATPTGPPTATTTATPTATPMLPGRAYVP